MNPKYKRGDWIRFMDGGQLRIGEVQYVKESTPARDYEYATDIGVVQEGIILEARKK